MTGIDLEEVRAAVAKRCRIQLDDDDPVLVVAVLCDEVMQHFVERVQAAAADVEQRGAGAMAQNIETSKKAAEQLIGGASRFFEARVKEAANEAATAIRSGIDQRILAAQAAEKGAVSARNWAVVGAVVVTVLATLGLGLLVGGAIFS